MKIDKYMKESTATFLIAIFGTYAFIALMIGSTTGYFDKKCNYDSIAARVNIVYILSCEFTKPRFDKE